MQHSPLIGSTAPIFCSCMLGDAVVNGGQHDKHFNDRDSINGSVDVVVIDVGDIDVVMDGSVVDGHGMHHIPCPVNVSAVAGFHTNFDIFSGSNVDMAQIDVGVNECVYSMKDGFDGGAGVFCNSSFHFSRHQLDLHNLWTFHKWNSDALQPFLAPQKSNPYIELSCNHSKT